MSANDEILVVARVMRDGGGGWVSYVTTGFHGPVETNWGNDQANPDLGDNAEQTSATVTVDVENEEEIEFAMAAAENIARALARIEAELEEMDPNELIEWGDGNSMKPATY